MEGDYRIKEYRTATLIPSGAPTAATTFTTTTNQSVNGEVLAVEWNTATVGSLSVAASGTGFEIFRRNAPSGAAWQLAPARQFGQITSGSVTAATMTPFVINEPLLIKLEAGSNAAISGLGYTVNIRYR